jgi:hypothetical protein
VNGQTTHPEDLTILAAVEALERGGEPRAGEPRAGEPRADEAAETLARLYAEVLGLVAYELPPLEPAAEVKARLLALVQVEQADAGDETQDVREPAPPTEPEPIRLTSLPAQKQAPPALPTTQERMRAVRPSLTPPPRPAPPRPRWPLAVAAALALVFAGLSGWLYTQLGQQRRTIDDLSAQLDRESRRAEGAVKEARQAESDALSMREKFALVTSPAVEASPMRPAGNAPLQPAARGVLFVASDHQHWYLRLHGVAPAPEGKMYKLWFVADTGPVSGGAFSARPGAPVELSSKQMPTGIKGVMITLEDDPRAATPAGPEVLRAAALYQLS